MGRYVFLLIAPVIIGALIAAAVVVLQTLRQRRTEAHEEGLAASSPDGSSGEPTAETDSSDVTRRRIAS